MRPASGRPSRLSWRMEDGFGAESASAELRALIERVEAMIGVKAREWVAAPNSPLSGRAPRDLVHTAADRERLEAYLFALEDGSYL